MAEEKEVKLNVNQKLMKVQSELKAPKGQYNSFGKYHYRSCEDILEGVKPLLSQYGATITLSDSIEVIGDRMYVKVVATFRDVDTGDTVQNVAFAREEAEKKGMDGAQVTGASSSYARKYCLNGLLLIDDTKDADTDENHNETQNRANKAKKADAPAEPKYFTEQDIAELTDLCVKAGTTADDFFKPFGGIAKCPASNYGRAKAELTKRINSKAKENG